MVYPALSEDTVLYELENIYGDKNITVTMLDGSELSIWGAVFVNGNPLSLIGSLPIATQAEAEAGVDNTKVMTPLRVSQAIDYQAYDKTASDLRYLQLAGGTLTGALTLSGAPTVDLHAATKAYVDGKAFTVSDGDKGEITVSGTGAVWTIDNSVITVAKLGADVTAKFVDVTGDTMTGDLTVPDVAYSAAWNTDLTVPTKNAVYDKIEVVDTSKVNKAGDTMTGTLDVPNVEISEDLVVSGGALISGDLTVEGNTELNGNVTLAHDPATDLEAATKQYVDGLTGGGGITQADADIRYINVTGDTMTGALSVPDVAYGVAWNGSVEVPTKNAVYDKIETIPIGITQTDADTRYINTTGDTMTGDLTVPDEVYGVGWDADLSVPTKNAVYDKIESLPVGITQAAADTRYINTTGDTMTGDLILNGNPGTNLGAATKQYVDTHVGATGGGIIAAFWTYNATTSAPPASGQIRTNAGLTELYIHETDTDGYDRTIGLSMINTGEKLWVRAANNTSANWVISGTPTDNGTYWTIPFTVEAGSGTVTKGARTQVNVVQNTFDATDADLLYVKLAGSTMTGDLLVPDEAYSSSWDSSLEVPTKNALYDKIETLSAGGGGLTQEQVEDIVAALFTAGTQTDVTVSYNDTTPSISLTVTGVPANSVATGDIADDAVTYAKIQNVSATDKLLGRSTSGAGDIEEITCTSFARTILDDTTQAAVRTTLALTPGTDVQAFDADLTTIAGLTATTDNIIQSVGSAWASRTPTQVKTALSLDNVTNTSDANKPVSTAQQTALDLKEDKAQTINAQTGTTYTLVLGDQSKLVTLSNASAITLTVPTNASVAFPVGTHVDIVQKGAGQVTVAGTPTVNSTPTKKTRAQYSGATLVKEATDTWYLFGDLAAT